jgi:hypothetical protein
VYAPNIISIASIAPNLNNYGGLWPSHHLNVNYTDLIGLPLDALMVNFKLNGETKATVDTYTVIDDENIQFTWTPSDYDKLLCQWWLQPLVFTAELTLKTTWII